MCDSTRCFQHNSDPCDFAVYFTCLLNLKKAEVFNRHTQGQNQMALRTFSRGVGIKKSAILTSEVFISSKLKFGVVNEICIVNCLHPGDYSITVGSFSLNLLLRIPLLEHCKNLIPSLHIYSINFIGPIM